MIKSSTTFSKPRKQEKKAYIPEGPTRKRKHYDARFIYYLKLIGRIKSLA